jgi:nucleotide-binding universal stress UspA family protein
MLLVRDDLYVRAINRILVPIDGTGVGDDALTMACELTRATPRGSLTGVHVTRQDITPSRGGKSPADVLLEKAVQRARALGVDLQPMHRTGDVARTVCATAEEIGADLLVIASQDRRPVVAKALVDLDRLLGSSVSDYIRVHAPAPVLLVREPERKVNSVPFPPPDSCWGLAEWKLGAQPPWRLLVWMYRTIRKTAGTRTNSRLATKPRSLVSMADQER